METAMKARINLFAHPGQRSSSFPASEGGFRGSLFLEASTTRRRRRRVILDGRV